jgi:hypothetical protein
MAMGTVREREGVVGNKEGRECVVGEKGRKERRGRRGGVRRGKRERESNK